MKSPEIVLYHPENPLNVGSLARGMANFGFQKLKLVKGIELDLEKAKTTSRQAYQIIEHSLTYNSLDDALNASGLVLGFSTKESKNTPPLIDLPFLGEYLQEQCTGQVSFLFGPESIGLTYKELPYCSAIVRIPSSSEYDSLNLSQAAMLAMYEFRRFLILRDPPQIRRFSASLLSYEIMEKKIRECAELTQFKTRGTPEKVLKLLTNYFRRIPLTPREGRILLGFLSRIVKTLQK